MAEGKGQGVSPRAASEHGLGNGNLIQGTQDHRSEIKMGFLFGDG